MKLTQLQQVLVGAGLILLSALLSHFVLLKSNRQRIKSLQNKNSQLEQDIRVAKAIQQTATELQEEMNHLKAQLERLKKILPVTINKPKFMADIKRYANENGIELLQLSNNKPFIDDVIVEHPFTYKARGNFHDFGRFFAQMSNYPRIINVKGLYLERQTEIKGYSVDSSFIVSVFTYNEPTEEDLKAQVEAKKQARKQSKKPKKG